MKINKDSNSFSSSPFKEGMKSLLNKKVALTVIIILSAVYLLGIFSPLIAPYSYSEPIYWIHKVAHLGIIFLEQIGLEETFLLE